MSVESVNNSNNNTGLYAAGAATIGAGAGAAAGWYSKPFLKDGAPTDSFVKSAIDNFKQRDELIKVVHKANSLEELKNLIIEHENIDNHLEEFGFDQDEIKEIEKCSNSQEKKNIMKKYLDAGVTEEDFKELKKGCESKIQGFTNELKDVYSGKKKLEDCAEINYRAIKKAARGIQTKYAAIYGGIAATVLGIGTYLLANNNKPEEQPEKVDTQA